MASEHVVNGEKNKGNNSLFSIFNRMIKSKHKNEKTCAALIDFLMINDENVGSVSAIDYSAKRLVRGLAAGENEKQNVFFSALCTGISKNVLSPNSVLQALNNIIGNTGSSKAEQSTKQLTTVLAYGAIVSSGRVSELNQEDLTNILQKLITTVNLKSHLKVAASMFLSEFLLNANKRTIKSIFVPMLDHELKIYCDKIENELFAVCALAYLKFSKVMLKIVDVHFGGRKKLFQDICDKSLFLPLPLQEQLVTLLCQEFTASLAAGAILIKLWKKFLEKDSKNSLKRNAYTLLFLKVIMDCLPHTELICQSLQPNALDVLLKSLQVHDKKAKGDICYIRAKQILEKLIARINDKSNETNLASKTLKIIFNHPGGLQFDRKTRSNTVHSMIMSLDTDEVINLADDFLLSITESFKGNNEKTKTPKDIESMLVMLVKLLSSTSIKKDNTQASKYIKFIFDIAFKKSLNVNADLRAKAADLFFKCLELNNVKIEDAAGILNEIVLYAGQNMDSLLIQLKEPEMKQWNSMMTANAKLSKKSSDKKYVAVRLLLLHMGLLMFRDQTLASSTIEELLQCYERIQKAKHKIPAITLDEEPHWVEVTIDLLLAMLSRENKLLRHVVSSVFPSIVPHITATVVQQIVDALDPGSRNDVLKHIDSDDSEDEGDDENKEESDEEDVEDEESDGSDEDAEEETVNDKLRMAVRNALGYSAALTDDESVDMDDMNEEEENRLNESLASAFRLFRSGKKKKQTKDDEALMHFRIRVLDLVEIITSTNPTLSCCLELLNPLYTLLENAIKDGHQKALQNRLEAVLKKLGSVKKFGNDSDVSYSDLVAALTGLFERDTSGLIYAEMATTLTDCCGMLIRGSQLLTKNEDDVTLEDVFNTFLTNYFKGNDRKIPYSIFQITLRMMWEGNWNLSKSIMSMLLDPDLKLFKKNKLIDLLEIFYKNDRLQSSATDDCKKATCTFEKKFVKKFTKSLEEYEARKNSNLLPTFYGRLISFVQLAMQINARFLEGSSKTSPWVPVVSHLLSNMQHLTQQKSRNKLLNLAQQSGLTLPDKSVLQVKPAKRVAASVKDSDEETSNEIKKKRKSEVSQEESEKGKKQKNSAEVKKLKQESRDLREAAFSQGLVAVNFSSINVESLGEIQPEVIKSKKSSQSHLESPASLKKSRKSETSPPKKKKQKLI